MTTKEASEKWGLSINWITALCASGRVRAVKVPTPNGSDRWEILQEEKPVPRTRPVRRRQPPTDPASLPWRQKCELIWRLSQRSDNRLSLREIARRLKLTPDDVRRVYDEELINRLHGGVDPLEKR